MVSKTYAPQFRVTDLEGADSRSVGYLIDRAHSTLIHQVQKLGLEYESGFHTCIRRSGKIFSVHCIYMTKANWLKYFSLTNKKAPSHLL
jgi:hypothetical protein